jgi:small-conductance mechanosensitive channel
VRRLRRQFARRSKRSAEGSPPSSSTAEKATAQKPSATTASPAPQASATPQAPADPQERIDGLRAWVAQVDRKLGVRTYVGAAIVVLALAAAAVGLALTLSLKQDAATNDDIQSLRDQISAVEQSASQAAQEDVQALDRRLTELEAEVNRISAGQATTRRELKVVQDDIKELRSQVSRAGSSSGGGSQGSQGSGP